MNDSSTSPMACCQSVPILNRFTAISVEWSGPLSREALFGNLCVTLPRLTHTVAFQLAEQWLCFGHGLEVPTIQANMSLCETRIRGRLSSLEARLRMEVSGLAAALALFEELERAVQQYCTLLVQLSTLRATPVHRRLVVGSVEASALRTQAPLFSNWASRQVHLASLTLRGHAGSFAPVVSTDVRQGVTVALYSVGTGSGAFVPSVNATPLW